MFLNNAKMFTKLGSPAVLMCLLLGFALLTTIDARPAIDFIEQFERPYGIEHFVRVHESLVLPLISTPSLAGNVNGTFADHDNINHAGDDAKTTSLTLTGRAGAINAVVDDLNNNDQLVARNSDADNQRQNQPNGIKDSRQVKVWERNNISVQRFRRQMID